MKGHLKHMAIAGGAILAVLLLAGVNLRDALPWALLLACPLMMVGMMFMMNRGTGATSSHDGQHGPHCHDATAKADEPRDRDEAALPLAPERSTVG